MMDQKKLELWLDQAERIRWFLKENIWTPVAVPSVEFAVSDEPVPFEERLSLSYKPIRVGETWSKTLFECGWFHVTCPLPEGEDLYLSFDADGEGCVFGADGTPVRGLTNKTSEFARSLGEPGKRHVPLEEVTHGGRVDAWIETGHNDLFNHTYSGTLVLCEVVRCNKKLRKLYYDLRFLVDLCVHRDLKDPQKYSVLYAVARACRHVHKNMTDEDIAAAEAELAPELTRKGAEHRFLELYAIGHSHLDLAWLWPLRETKRKAARTFATALRNLERYPFYIYGASQPQQFAWVKEAHPKLYAQIKEAVKGGRFELQGGMWVEPDTNVTGGESLIRQFLYGKKFWREEFGKDTDILWLPDVFGFSGNLPQIMRICGVDKMLTIKISWNTRNKFPYHSFIWQGIDGSEVLVHMPPEGTYSSSAAPHALLEAQEKYCEKGLIDKAMLLYGIGDGGGGPGDTHLEFIAREADVYGLPRVKNATGAEFFAALERDADKLAVYRGEMYLEKHQGTYTSQAKNKYHNRRIEAMLSETEFLCACAAQKGAAYPQEELEEIWKEVLLYQFHDILPGSSIRRVYDESVARYCVLEERLTSLSARAAASLGGAPCAVNATSFEREEYVKHGGKWYAVSAQPYSAAELGAEAKAAPPSAAADGLENEFVRVRFGENGEVLSLYDKTLGTETLQKPSNLLRVYNDVWDAWDFSPEYAMTEGEAFRLRSTEPFTDGPVAGVRQVYVYGDSVLTQEVTLTAGSRIVAFRTHADWHESEKMLRVVFYPAVFTDTVQCDIQFGSVTRRTTANNSIEDAQYEICAHKWVDVSEADRGLALLNDCKYGYGAKNGVLSVNLLRSQNGPCVGQDKGEHDFSYALYPHAEHCDRSDVRKQAYLFNRPLRIMPCGAFGSFAGTGDERIVIETIKRAEDGNGVVLRLYNDSAVPRKTELRLGFPARKILEADALENVREEIGRKEIAFRPFEIKTILVR